jgi:hypothetical protein
MNHSITELHDLIEDDNRIDSRDINDSIASFPYKINIMNIPMLITAIESTLEINYSDKRTFICTIINLDSKVIPIQDQLNSMNVSDYIIEINSIYAQFRVFNLRLIA